MGRLVVSVLRIPHKVNGKLLGAFYHFDNGRSMYLAYCVGQKPKALFLNENAWCIDTSIIRQCQREGCEAIGIAHRVGKHVDFYITNLTDFLDSPSEVHSRGAVPQRRLSRDRFMIDTSKSEESIVKAMRLK